MQRGVEIVMTSEEHGDLTNIIGTEKVNISMLVELLKEKDLPKQELLTMLSGTADKLAMVDKMLRGI